MPPMRSIYSFPFVSYSKQPSAFLISNANGEGEVCAMCLRKSSLSFTEKNYFSKERKGCAKTQRIYIICKCVGTIISHRWHGFSQNKNFCVVKSVRTKAE